MHIKYNTFFIFWSFYCVYLTASDTVENLNGTSSASNQRSDSTNLTLAENDEIFTLLGNSSKDDEINSTLRQLDLISRKETVLRDCKGTVNVSKFEILSKGRRCEFSVFKNENNSCQQLELDTIGWDGECDDNWLEAGGTLECGVIPSRRILQLTDKGLVLRFSSKKGKLIGRQMPCQNSTSPPLMDRFGEDGSLKATAINANQQLPLVQNSPGFNPEIPCGPQPCQPNFQPGSGFSPGIQCDPQRCSGYSPLPSGYLPGSSQFPPRYPPGQGQTPSSGYLPGSSQFPPGYPQAQGQPDSSGYLSGSSQYQPGYSPQGQSPLSGYAPGQGVPLPEYRPGNLPPPPPSGQYNPGIPCDPRQCSNNGFPAPIFQQAPLIYTHNNSLLFTGPQHRGFTQGRRNPNWSPYNSPRDAAVWEVYSPGYPEPYISSGDCVMSLPVPPSCSLSFSFQDFQVGRVGREGQCVEGWLEAGGFRFCGCQTGLVWRPPPGITKSGSVNFHLRGSGRFLMRVTVTPLEPLRPGPDLRWQCVPPAPQPFPNPYQCPILPWKSGTINLSPQPGNFCYRFDTEKSIGCGTMLKLDDFRMRSTPGCVGDYLLAGSQRYCQQSTPTTMVLDHGDYLRGRLSGDSMLRASYAPLMCTCDSHFKQPQVAIKGPEADSCTYTIHRAIQEVCNLELIMETLNLDCRYESLYAGGKFYCGNLMNQRVKIPFYDPSTTIRYENRGSGPRGNYLLQIKQKTDCFNSVLNDRETLDLEGCLVPVSGMSGEIKSPTDLPERPTKCTYLFATQKGICWVRLDFNKFDFSSSPDCKGHHFKINGENFCGESLAFKTKVVSVKNNNVLLDYSASQGDSWSFRYSQLPCGPQQPF